MTCFIRPNKTISVCWVTGLIILGRVGTHNFFYNYFFFWKKYNFMYFETFSIRPNKKNKCVSGNRALPKFTGET